MRELPKILGLAILLTVVASSPAAAAAPKTGIPESAVADSSVLAEIAAEKPRQIPRVPWLTDKSWPEILDQAHTADQPVLIDFTATWCGPCKLLDVMVFTEKPVISELAEVVTMQVDIDKPEYLQLKTDFAVEVVPTLVWCNQRGEEIDRFTGYVSSAQFMTIVQGWRGNRTIDRVLSERQSASPEDPAMLLDVARRQAERGKDREADVLYRRLMNLRHEADPRLVARGMLGLAEMEHRFGREEEARHLAGRVAALYTSEDAPASVVTYRNEGMMEAALFQESIGDTLGMLNTFRTLAEADHRNALALHGYARAAVQTGIDLVPATRSAIRAVVYSDNDPDVMSTLAECYYWRGLYSKAIKWQRKSVDAAPHQKLYRAQLALYEDAKAADPHGMRGPPKRNR